MAVSKRDSVVPDDLRYTAQHEWIRVVGKTGVVGITDHAQDALSDVTFVGLPPVGKQVKRNSDVCVVESCKIAADIFAPAGGKIAEVNSSLEKDPSVINSDPYGKGWIYRLDLSDETEIQSLMTPEQYRKFLSEGKH